MNKVFIPQVGAVMELVSDSTLSLSTESRAPAEETILLRKGIIRKVDHWKRIDTKTGRRIGLDNQLSCDVVFPAGTIFKITKMAVKNRVQPNMTREADQLTLQIVYSPDKDISKSGRIAIDVKIINRLDMEWVDTQEKESGR